MNATTTRRNFLRMTTAAVSMPAILPTSVLGLDAGGSADRIRMAAIGIGPRGRLVLDKFLKQPDVRFVAVCDVQPSNLRTAKMMVDRANKDADCSITPDMREILASNDI